MTDKTEELELEVDTSLDESKPVEIDLESGDAVAAKADGKPDDKPVEDEGIKSLREQMDAMRAAKDNEVRKAQEDRQAALDEAAKARTQVGESNYQVVVSALEATKREGDQAEADYAKAMDEGRYADAAKAQRIMARVEGRLDQLDNARLNIEAERKAPPKAEGAIRPQEPQRQVDPVEALASQLSPASAAWVREHKECATDPVLYQEMVAADARARRLGHNADTPEYFNFIEERLGFTKPAVEEKPAPRRAVPAAPVSRDAPGTPSNRRSVTLSPEEQEVAQMNGMTNAEYARYKFEYQNEKTIN